MSNKGYEELNTGFNTTNTLDFFVEQRLKGIFTCDLVRVVAVEENTVDVVPLVYQVSGNNEILKQEPIYGVPYCRQQAGVNGIILKPEVNDLGVVVYARRDISSVISSGGENVPDTRRILSENDAIYLCSLASLMGAPTRFIEFSSEGITMTPNTTLTINGDVIISGNVEASGTVTALDCISGTISGLTHVHGGVASGQAKTGVPEE